MIGMPGVRSIRKAARNHFGSGRRVSFLDEAYVLIPSSESAQTEDRKNDKDDNNEADNVYDPVHGNPLEICAS